MRELLEKVEKAKAWLFGTGHPHGELHDLTHKLLEKLIAEVEAMKGGVDVDMDDHIKQRLQEIASGVGNDMQEFRDNVTRTLSSMSADLSALKSSLSGLQSRLADLENNPMVLDGEAGLESVRDAVTTLGNQASALAGRVAALEPKPTPPAETTPAPKTEG